MSAACQVKLLRVLQEGTIRPVGARSETRVDARVITATNRNLALEMQGRRFREDLFYRIAVLTINAPPLKRRISDIPLLIDHFLGEAEKGLKCVRKRRFEKEAIKILSTYAWPGNVRQRRHVVEKLVATTADGEIINADLARRALPNGHLTAASAQVPLVYHEDDSLEAFLDRTLLSLYEQLLAKSGSHSQAARLLRIDRTSLYQRLERARRRTTGGVY
jgi:DNA-binding NtrC family response regulator